MPFNGAGVFTRVYQWVQQAALGQLVNAPDTDTDTNDIANGLTNCVTRDGQSPWLANLPAGGYKITGLGTGALSTDSVTYGQVFNNPSFVTPSATTTPTLGSNNLRLATTAYVDQTAFSTELPAQTGNAGKFLSTDGTNASWTPVQVLMPVARTSDTPWAATDKGSLFTCTGTWTQTSASAATLGAGWFVQLSNDGTGEITIPSSDGVTNWKVYPGELREFFVNEAVTGIESRVLKSFSLSATSSITFTKPPGYKEFSALALAGAGGGGSGRRGAAGSDRGGGSGGGGGAYVSRTYLASELGATESVTIGAGGAGGTAITADSTNGNAGSPGGSTTFSSGATALIAYGGAGGGGGGTSGSGGGGAGGGGTMGAPSSSTGGAPRIGSASVGSQQFGGGDAASGADAQASGQGGGGGGASFNNFSASGYQGGCSLYGGAGGGAGGALDSGNVARAGGAGGTNTGLAGGGGSGGAATGANGTAGSAQQGGGGGGAGTGAGGTGGAGGTAAGGGGGSASVNGNNSGAGGAGGNGLVIVWGVA